MSVIPYRDRAVEGGIVAPRNAMSVSIYALVVVIGVLHLMDVANAVKMQEYVGENWSNAWALGMVLGGLLGGLGALAGVPTTIRLALRAESAGCLLMALAMGFYLGTLVTGYPFAQSLTTKSLALAVVVGCLLRLTQNLVTLHRIRRFRRTAPVLPTS